MTTHSTFTIERHYPAAPQRVFAAWADPASKGRWWGQHRKPVELAMDFRPGGVEQNRFTMGPDTPFPGTVIVNRTVYQDIIPDRRIVFAYTMAFGDQPFSASLTTIELEPSGTGTRLVFTEQGAFFEHSDGKQLREEGWTGLLDRLGEELERA